MRAKGATATVRWLPHENSPALTPARARLSRRCAWRRTRRSSTRERPARRGARARVEQAARPASTSSGCTGAGPARCSSGRARSPVAGAPGRRRLPRPRTSRTRAPRSARALGLVAAREPVVGRPVRPDRVPPARQGDQAPRVLRLEPELRASPDARSRRPARPRSSRAAAGTRTRRSGALRRRSHPLCGSRSCTTRPARTGTRAAQSPAIVRAIQLYHVKGNGWNDIGYNFLVDRFGQVFEGRYGGIERNVVGAHAEGFNTGSVGVSLLGEYSSLAVSQKARDALAALLAWRLDIAHVDPASTLSFISGGNARFPAGLPVFLRTVSGHRDAGFTDCPGQPALRPAHRSSRATSRGAACRSCTRRSSPAPCRARCASRRGCRRRCPGRSRPTTRPGTSSPRGPASGPTWTGRGTRRCSRPAATRTRSGRRTA